MRATLLWARLNYHRLSLAERPARGKEKREDTLSAKRSASKLHLADLHGEGKIHRREIDRPRQMLDRFVLARLEYCKMISTGLMKFLPCPFHESFSDSSKYNHKYTDTNFISSVTTHNVIIDNLSSARYFVINALFFLILLLRPI